MAKMGRPRKQRATPAASNGSATTISLEGEAAILLDDLIENLSGKLGFRPTRSQALSHLIKVLTTNPDPSGS